MTSSIKLGRFQRKLRALEYPKWNRFDIESMDDIKQLVLFLEQTAIRELKVAERKDLKNTKSKQWMIYLNDYLQEVESPLNVTGNKMSTKQWTEIVEWLVSQAIFRAYQDNKNELNQRKPIRRIEKREYAMQDCYSLDCTTNLKHVCNFLKIPFHENPIITAQTLNSFVKTKFNSLALANYEAFLKNAGYHTCAGTGDDYDMNNNQQRPQDGFEANTVNYDYENRGNIEWDPYSKVFDVDSLLKYYGHYLGFTTGDRYVDAACIILRVLYVNDVRQTQNQLTEIVTFLQKFTAYPKTNPKLGRVGS